MPRTIELIGDKGPRVERVSPWNPHQSAWILAECLREDVLNMAFIERGTAIGYVRAAQLREEGFFEEGVGSVAVFYRNECLRVGIEVRDLTDKEREQLEAKIPDLFLNS
ncbi:MAG: hypothetical protein A3D26_04385 [Candidatus Blackburnbacteria bacterium RIFCSPHIGHO2_02_FULL_44_20]|uniref:Uncharacterized protein n=1 Tax=Candidatus Blackburnbacteria bacterium RIFCSPHIGHO2_02_FULL_44_20 TaxID=1797516 RepID=A0A1G1V6G8_9BACT|nr:MAG: hypothetical protein A3D26_04385 [Candidatus Blackburnbacteria bacterium RIFCSPHIGHO2_02_FULL_44_20]OGY11001.1 MAG: hypothetical protein A3E16_01135 [Candidatus Blackburnbacteria bacterium RIFCSPHIGHO2_12_FULL_44_25]